MKQLLLSAIIGLLYNAALAQAKMTITLKNHTCEIYGYTMDPDATGNKSSVSFFGAMQSVQAILAESYAAQRPIDIVEVVITDADEKNNSRMEFKNLTVYAIKEYTSTYSNGLFNITSSAYVNTEIKCKFSSLAIYQNSSGNTGADKNNLQDKQTVASSKIWEIQPDAGLTGLTGSVVMNIPKGIAFNTHIKFYEAGDDKNIVASWFGNNSTKFMPGLYDMHVDDEYIIKNIPVEQGKQTRLKMGVLQWSAYGGIQLEGVNHQKFSYAAPFKVVLPEGTYIIVGRKQKPNTFEITDGKLTEF